MQKMRRKIILTLPGLATHLWVSDKETACGLIGVSKERTAYDPRDVDCANCRRTKRWKAWMGEL